MTGTFLRPLVAAALLSISIPALAEPAFSTAQVRVDTSGIDLTSAAGRQTLERRINTAISAMCGAPVFGTRDEADALRACRTEARAAAEPQRRMAIAQANTVALRN